MTRGGTEPWNLRDTHMADTLDRLLEHHGPESRGIVWEHNTHVGDARFTDMSSAGLINVGELARRRHGAENVVLIGFGGYEGSVVAADAWGAPARRMAVPPAVPQSHEDVVQTAVGRPCLFVFGDDRDGWPESLRRHRAIGVVYHPEREAYGNWVPTVIGSRYDVFMSFPHTEALHPLAGLEPEEVPEGPVV
jgi:erythromycin esterase-like protein